MEGKMEGKTRKVKRLALFTAAFMAALFLFTGQPHKVFAQPLNPQVSPNGVGDLLVFSYWTTDERETFIAIVNAFGPVQVVPNISRFVHIRVREGATSREMIDFTICLSPGDVWTASLTSAGDDTSSNLTVGNPGSCDAAVAGFGFIAPPPSAFPLRISASSGYIEAATIECNNPAVCGSLTGNNIGGDDTIWGVATVVNTSDGFSSSYNATAFVNFNAPFEAFVTVGTPRASTISQALAREGGVDKEILFARYVAGDIFAAETQIVLTFPAGFQPGADPVSLYFFDEEENPNLFSHEVLLPWEVNVCKITYVSGAPTTGDLVQNVSCPGAGNDFDILGLNTFGGWVRIINNRIGPEDPNINQPPATRFPVIGTVFSSFFGGGGTINYDQSFPIQWAAIGGAGGVGGIGCRVVGGVIVAATCNSFDIASTFAPWYIPDSTTLAGLINPGDNSSGALLRTGTTGP